MNLHKNIAISESGFIFNSATGDSFSANPLGAEIIDMLKIGKSKEEIKHHSLEKYDIDDDTFEKDFYDYINLLKQYQLLS